MHPESYIRPPLIHGSKTYEQITNDIARAVEAKPSQLWWIVTTITFLVFCWGSLAITWTVWFGIGTWGLNRTIGWGWDITNFVWWIGIGHAGTLISAILYLFRQKWRTGINRAAEAMTLFAVLAALQYPTFHVGRVWFLYWVFPIPNQMSMWPNFRSPLLWDVFAVSTYGTVSLPFWF